MGTTFSLPGQPSNYVQVNEVGLKNCLANQTDKNSVNNCINQNIVGPSNNTQVGVNPWNSEGLPPNPTCPPKQNSSSTIGTINGAFGANIQNNSSAGVAFGGNLQNNNSGFMSNFQNVDNFDILNINLNQSNAALLIVIAVTLLIVLMTK